MNHNFMPRERKGGAAMKGLLSLGMVGMVFDSASSPYYSPLGAI